MELKRTSGFTIIELVLYVSLASMIFYVASTVLFEQVDAYGVITQRQRALSDSRAAMDRITHELLRLQTSDIIAIASTQLDFTDEDSLTASFRQAANGSLQAIYRINDLLLSPITSLTFQYYDSADAITAVIANVRKIKATIVTDEIGNEGEITVSSIVTPRAFIYENYQ